MPKPSRKELMLRIRAVLKYTQSAGDQADIVGPFYLDSRHMRLPDRKCAGATDTDRDTIDGSAHRQ